MQTLAFENPPLEAGFTMDTKQNTTFEALTLLVKAHQYKMLRGVTDRFINHLDEIQKFTIHHIFKGGSLNSDTSFDFSASNVRKYRFNVVREIIERGKRHCTDHVVTVVPSSSVYGFTVKASGGGNRDLAGKPEYHAALEALFTKSLRALMPSTWEAPDLHITTFITDEDPLAGIW